MATKVAQKQASDQSKIQWYDEDTSRELVAYCPGCKALETIAIGARGFFPTSRYALKNGKVYHHCGSAEPCRLYSLN